MASRDTPLRALVALFGLLALLLLAARCRAAEPRAVERLRARVLASHPHDPASFTQGLLWHDGSLYESTGLYGASRLRRLDPVGGDVQREVELAADLFGEGLARVDDRLVQLTWQNGLALIYDLASFAPLGQVAYDGEGWGLCHDGAELWMSDGSSFLTRRDPRSFAALGRRAVTFEGAPVGLLNELECAEGWVYANVLDSDRILRIDPVSGEVRAVIDAAALLTRDERAQAGVLNGIAYDPESETFYVTGKNWPRLFAVVFE